MVRGRRIPRKRRLFVGCEGESEQGYTALLQRHVNDLKIPVYADAKVVTRAGDPLAKVQRAIKIAKQGEQGSRSRYEQRFLLLDRDRLGSTPARDSLILAVAVAGHMTLIWQDCCFEAVLLRHLAGHEQDNPPTAALALTRLNAAWPGYGKGLSAHDLQKTLTLDMIRQAAQNPRNADFLRFLQEMGLLKH